MGLERLGVRRRFRLVVAEREKYAVGVPMEIGIEHGPFGQFAFEQFGFSGHGLPVVEYDKPWPRARIAAHVLVHFVRIVVIGDSALDA